GPWRTHLRVFLCRPLRQCGHAGWRLRGRRLPARREAAAREPRIARRRFRHPVRCAHRYIHSHQLHRKRCRSRGWCTDRTRQCGHRRALPGRDVLRAAGRCDSAYATAPALILVGALMCSAVARVNWRDFSEAFPAFLTLVATPLTFSIATGLSLGLLSFTFVKLGTGRHREISPLLWVLSVLFLLRYAFLGAE